MNSVYNIEFDNAAIKSNLSRMQGQVFKCLCLREEEENWTKPLETVFLELLGYSKIFNDQKDILSLLCKLKGLLEQGEESDFMFFRRTIFEGCSLLNKLKEEVVK